jgi:organic radical activating enzyme
MNEVRRKMMNGEPLKECTRCYEHEARGFKSFRDQDEREEYIALTKPDGSLDLMPETMELHYGNMCNLKCKMCGQNYSNQIGKELLEIGKTDKDFLSWIYKQSGNVNIWTNNLSVEYKWFKNIKTKNKLMKYVSDHTQRLTVIGGEPTIIPEFYELLDYCYKQDTLKNKTIILTTNLTNVNPKMTDWLPKLKSWVVYGSIDGLNERQEYIRYPSSFDKVVENLNFYTKLLKKHGNGKITFSPAIQLLNIDTLDEMIKWFIDFADGDFAGDNGRDLFDISWLCQVWYPKICNYDIAPTDYKNYVADKLSKSIDNFKKYKQITHYYKNQIENLRLDPLSENEKNDFQSSFIRYNDTQDKHRGKTTWRQLLPRLEKALING